MVHADYRVTGQVTAVVDDTGADSTAPGADPAARVRIELSRFERVVLEVHLADRDAEEIARRLAGLAEHLTGTAGQRAGGGAADLARLSPREREVAWLIAKGSTNRQIARSLDLRVNTVQVHVAHILRKLDVRSRSAVARVVTLAEAGTHIPPQDDAR